MLHADALHGRPFDGHTLIPVLNHMQDQTGILFERAYVDKGYRGHQHPQKSWIFISGQKRGITATIKRELTQTSALLRKEGHFNEFLE